MIAKALFLLLLALSAAFLLSAVRRREGIFQFPALFAGAFLFSIVPQLVNHVFYPGLLPARVYLDHGVEYGLLMCILCLVAGITGYRGLPRAAFRPRKPMPRIDMERLFRVGVVLGLIGLFGGAQLAALAGGWKAEFVEGGHYELEWSGAPIIWTYVAKLLPLGLLLCLNATLARGGTWKWLLTILMMLYPLAFIVFLGRRQVIFDLALVLAMSLWFQRRWAPPRWLSIGCMALGGMVIILAPHYRTYANQTGDIWGAITGVDVRSAVEAYGTGDQSEGMDNLMIGIPARLAYPSFSWGSGFWNAVVAYWVPGQIVGHSFKRGLALRCGASDGEVFSKYCGQIPTYGSYSTGPYSVFREFWFLGCLVFLAVGRFCRWLWRRAEEHRDPVAQLIYASCAGLIPMSLVSSVAFAFAMFLLPIGIWVPLSWLIRDQRPRVPGPVAQRSPMGSRAARPGINLHPSRFA